MIEPFDRLRWIPLAGWMLLIFVQSSRPALPAPPGFRAELLAIAAHLVLFGVVAVLTLLARRAIMRPTLRECVLAVVVATLYGITDEVHQSFVPQRRADVFDVLTDMVGAIIAVSVVATWAQWRQRRNLQT